MFIPQPLFKLLCSLGFGVRSLDFADFEKACEHFGFKYFLTDEKYLEEGLTFPRSRHGKKYKIIVLKKILFLNILAEVAWHEFGHAYFEHYGIRLFVRGTEDKIERQADDFSLLCQIPTLWVKSRSFSELRSEGFTDGQIYRRKEIFESCGL